MKASELRIGNLIWDSELNDYFQVEELRKNIGFEIWIAYRDGSVLSKDVEHIPLTEEWLLKFGFKNNTTHFTKWVNSNDTFILLITEKENEYNLCDIDLKVIIKYVHQLQNLYFALTGEELTIKNQ